MLAVSHSGALHGIDALPVQVEVNTGESGGEVKICTVGLPDAAVKESSNRVWAAIINSGWRMPQTMMTINLAPGDIRKEGPSFDLPIALSILAATGQLDKERLAQYLIAGELSLSGATRPVKGALSMAVLARDSGRAGLLLPVESAREAALIEAVPVYAVKSLDEAARFIEGEIELERVDPQSGLADPAESPEGVLDFAEVKGQTGLRRAVEIAVAGAHNLLMIGPPGSGKSMIAKRIPTIMPEPSLEEFLEILRVQSAAGVTLKPGSRVFQRPFRAPHHTISDVGLLGGGVIPGPGEISMAHNGVLFLDELPEFRRSTLEVMRQPLEDGQVTISRSAGKVTLPSSFMLIAAMNPTPSGYGKNSGREVMDSPAQIQRYRSRISGPLLDRIDLHVEAPALTLDELRSSKDGESSAAIRERVQQARARQQERLRNDPDSAPGTLHYCNARMTGRQLRRHCPLTESQGKLLQGAMEELKLSARAYDRILKVARTIADLAESDALSDAHLLEAIHYRGLDRNLFY
ncbi:MAG: YifB family Mg chelatase-like AAA ATPase [Verrucomicrobiota bacterium]